MISLAIDREPIEGGMMTTEVNVRTVDPATPVGQIAAAAPATTRIFERWKIDYCCGGGLALEKACERAGAPLDQVLVALEEVLGVPGERNWSEAPLAELSAHIVETHHRYTREELELLSALSAKVEGVHGENHPEMREVARIVRQLHPELFQHMMKEEQILFPYVADLENAVKTGQKAPLPFFGTVENPIRMMIAEHDQAAEMLGQLRTATRNYDLPGDACNSYRALYHRLQELERDLHLHIHKENNIYFPRALDLEQKTFA
ncbi:MAG TPA: iron-sulfur cluster repair di-iron protein [Thermoanaerobaculia bacterium]|nr:iron-sulfur cluster repair di-iron protein [Thermoanaerobaculia bacterium]